MRPATVRIAVAFGILGAWSVVPAQAQQAEVPNWTAPTSWAGGALAKSDLPSRAAAISGPLPLVAVTPCRLMDTRPEYGFSGQFGPPAVGSTERIVAVSAGACGIPSTARAYSLNVTVVPSGPLSFLTVWPTGSVRPNVSTLNSFQGNVVANAAVVAAGTAGAISVFASGTTHVILDINGYYSEPAGSLVGATGPAGPTGATGAAGPLGPNSTTPGPNGPTGATGAAGAVGVAGPSGATGPVGVTGVAGTAGATGVAGPTGAAGPAGLAGATGATGAIGLTGAAGPAGATGPLGATGPGGPAGATGANGLAGPTGATGAPGIVGPSGATGATGLAGTAGVAGPTGATGATGSAGLASTIPGIAGVTGATGPAGAAGATGASNTGGVTAYAHYTNDSGSVVAVVLGGTDMSLSAVVEQGVSNRILATAGTYKLSYCVRMSAANLVSARLTVNGTGITSSTVSGASAAHTLCRDTVQTLAAGDVVNLQLFGLLGAVVLTNPGGADLQILKLN